MVLDGRIIANIIKEKIKNEIKENGYEINLAVILVGNDEASKIYIKHKKIACEYVGIKILVYKLESDIKQDDLLSLIYKLNQDKNITGILVQLPLPNNIDATLVMQSINYLKGVYGFHPDFLLDLFVTAAFLMKSLGIDWLVIAKKVHAIATTSIISLKIKFIL